MSLDTFLEDVLPTKWSRRLAVATIALATGAYNLPSILPSSWLPNSQEQIFLLRVMLLETTALLGAFVVIVLLVVEVHASRSRIPSFNVNINKNQDS